MDCNRDLAENWLAENDPLYYDWRERKKLNYPYLTKRQLETIKRKEIPVGINVFER